jgi:hypothetical protein
VGTERGMDVGFIVLVGSRLSSESVRVERENDASKSKRHSEHGQEKRDG